MTRGINLVAVQEVVTATAAGKCTEFNWGLSGGLIFGVLVSKF